MKRFFIFGILALVACGPVKPKTEPDMNLDRIIKVNDVDVMVVGLSKNENYEGQRPDAIAVAVTWGITNNSGKPMPASKAPVFHLMDAKGTIYNASSRHTAAYYATKPVSREDVDDLNPGLFETDAAVFEVARSQFDETNWYLSPGDGRKYQLCWDKQMIAGKCARWPWGTLLNPVTTLEP